MADESKRFQLIRISSAGLMIFLLHEGFYLLPEKWVILFPGSLRMSDIFFLVFPAFLLFFFKEVFRTFHRYKEEYLMILAACALVFISALMANYYFNQPYLRGLLLIRHNLDYLSFFIFIILLRNLEDVDKLLDLLTILIGLYVVILLLSQYIPDIGIIQVRKTFYTKTLGWFRFGEKRFFFPHGDVPIFFYCLILARLLCTGKGASTIRKVLYFAFLLLVIYAILSTYTRILVFSLLVVTTFALYNSKRRVLKYSALVLISIVVAFQLLSMAVSERGISLVEESKLGKMVLQSGDLSSESGRNFQLSMYIDNFLKSPILGVGVLVNVRNRDSFLDEDLRQTYRRYGFFNAVDLGYMKIVAESGLVGITWVAWFYFYFYRRGKQILTWCMKQGNPSPAEAVARGLGYFLIYLIVSGLTLPHFVISDGIIIIALSLAFMAVTHKSMNDMAATTATPYLGNQ